MYHLRETMLTNIIKDYDTFKIGHQECFHQLKKVLGTWYAASKHFQGAWMKRPGISPRHHR